MSLRAWCVFLAVLAAPSVALAADGKDEAELERRLEKLEEENAKLKAELAEAKADTRKLFDAATKAEKSAGLDFRRPTAVVVQSAPAGVPPVGQPAAKHAGLRLAHAELTLDISFGPPRSVRTWRVHDSNCDVTKKNR